MKTSFAVEYADNGNGTLRLVGRYPFESLASVGDTLEIAGKRLDMLSLRCSAYKWAKRHGVRFAVYAAGRGRAVVKRLPTLAEMAARVAPGVDAAPLEVQP